MTDRFDTIIIGAGFAGAVAAREAGRAGKRVLILEARDRLGGRTWTSEFEDHAVEMGGTWIHWIQPHVWAELTRYGLSIVESPGNANPGSCAWVTDGRLKTGTPDQLEPILEDGVLRFCEDAKPFLERPYEPLFNAGIEALDAMSIKDRLDEMEMDDEQRDVMLGLWTSTCSTSCEKAGYVTMLRWCALCRWSYAMLLDATSRYKFRDGTRSLIEALIADGAPDICLDTPVSRIEQSDDGVVVTTHSGEAFSGDTVIVSVPLNTLNDIEFSPELSAPKLAAAREGQASEGVKVWARLKGSSEHFYGVTPGPAALTWVQSEYTLEDGLIVVGFGPDANLLDVEGVGQVQEAIRVFLPDAEVVSVSGHDWNKDPYSKGLWPIFRPRQLTRYLQALQQPEGRLFFCGSETANGWNGFIDGAIESGLRAAREALRTLGE
jgi:monoamine oxidase